MAKLTSTSFEELPVVSKVTQTLNVTIDSTALDAGNTGKTSELRAGLLLAYETVIGAFVHYQPSGSNGSDTADYMLMGYVDLTDGGDAASDHTAVVMAMGAVVSGKVLLQDAAALVDLAKAGGGLGWIEFV